VTLYSRLSARRSLLDTIAFRIVSQTLTILGYVVLVRGMSASDFGVYTLLYAFVPVIGTLASFGLEQVLARYQPEYLARGDRAAAAWLFRFIAVARLLSNLAVLALVLAVWEHVAPLFQLEPYRGTFAGFGLLIVLHFQGSILRTALASHMLHRHAVASAALLALVKLAAYGALGAYDALTLEAALAADTLAYAAAYVWMRLAYRHHCPSAAPWRHIPAAPERRRMLRYGLLNNFNDAGVILIQGTMESFFLAAFASTAAVGIYNFYYRLKVMVANALPVRLFADVIRPVFFSVPRSEADRRVPQYFTFLLNMSLLVQWPTFAFTVAYHAEIVEAVFGGKFIEDSWLLPIIMAFALLNTAGEPATVVAHYQERAGTLLLSKVFGVYNLLAMTALVPLLGVYGAALAAGTAQLLKNGFIWYRVRGLARWTNAGSALALGMLVWSGAVAVAVVLQTYLGLPPAADLAVGLVVFAAAGTLHVRSAAISAADRELLAALAPAKALPLLHRVGLLGNGGKVPAAA